MENQIKDIPGISGTGQKGTPKRRVHPLVRLYHGARSIACVIFLVMAALAFPENTPTWIWVLLVLWTLGWPHVAYLWARSAKEPKKAEEINLLTDCVVIGMTIAYFNFQILPSLGFFLASFTMTTLTGGFRLLAKAVLASFLGLAFVVSLVGFHPILVSSNGVMVVSLIGTLGFTILTSYLTWRQTLVLIGLRARMREKKVLVEKLHDEVTEANDELQDFSRIVAHDLKAPLRGIGILSDNLGKDYNEVLDESGKKSLALMAGRVKRMQALIDGVLNYSRAAVAEQAVEPVDLQALLPDISQVLSHGRSIKISLPENLPTVVADPTRVEQVFQNLMSNAVKYMDKENGIVEVRWRAVDSGYRFEIVDNGPGIAPKYHQQIFLVFRTLQSRDSYESTGVGLSVVKKIVERWGGEIGVDSQEGEGATFWFTMPQGLGGQNP